VFREILLPFSFSRLLAEELRTLLQQNALCQLAEMLKEPWIFLLK